MVVRVTFHRTDQSAQQVSSVTTFDLQHAHYVSLTKNNCSQFSPCPCSKTHHSRIRFVHIQLRFLANMSRLYEAACVYRHV